MKKNPALFLGPRVFVATAHPDDESYASGTLFAHNKKYGGITMIVCATLGEKGASHLKQPLSVSSLKKRRKQELMKAATIMGAQKVVTLAASDGAVKKQIPGLFRRYLKLARAFKPDVIVGFDETGMTGHWDHIAIGRVGLRVARKLKRPYYAFALSPQLRGRIEARLKSRRRARTYIRTLRFRKPDIRVAVAPTIKVRVLRAHASQLDSPRVYAGYPAIMTKELLRAEYFRKLN